MDRNTIWGKNDEELSKINEKKFIHKLKELCELQKNKLKKKKKDSHKGKEQILKVMVRRLTSHNKQRWLEDYRMEYWR